MSATETPVAPLIRRRPKRASEFDSRSVKINQRPTLVMPPIDQKVERASDITVAETPLIKDMFDVLAFNEEPIEIFIHASGEKNAPPCTDYLAINDIAAEMLFKNGWIRMGYLPRGQNIITKRKYVEVLARSKYDAIETKVLDKDSDQPKNHINRTTISKATFSVIDDKNPRGKEWLSQLLRMN